jgi:DNA-binding CsgD family transcriptional regulator
VHDTVSREHAEVWSVNDRLHLHDLGSSNGTRVNDARIDEAAFAIGDTLRLGDVMLDVTAQELIDESSVFFERQPTKVSDADDNPSEAILRGLSGAQRRVLRLLLTGKSEKEVAEELHISPHTVHSHVKQIYKQFAVGSRPELMAFFIDRALISRTQ